MEVESISNCPVCDAEGYIFLENCEDYNFGIAGTWSFKKCKQCKSLWIDPRPKQEYISLLYPENGYFTDTEPQSQLIASEKFLKRLILSIKLGILEHKFNYPGLFEKASIKLGFQLGKLISFFPAFCKWAGYTIRFIPYQHEGHLLEVGAGNGSFLLLMKELGWQVTGIEPDLKASQKAINLGLNIVSCGVEETILESNTYDAIVLHHVIEHIAKPKLVIDKLVNALKPGGVLVSIAPNPTGIISSLFKSKWYELDSPRHLVLPSPEGYQYLFEKTESTLKVSTTMKISFWVWRESLRLYKTGKIGFYSDKLALFLTILGSFLSKILPNIGEEVICQCKKLTD